MSSVIAIEPAEILPGWRARTDLGDVAGLAASIAEVGQLHPIVVITGTKPSQKYRLVAGMRRLKACQQLKRKVQATVIELGDELHALDAQLAENMQRKDFDRIEVGEGLVRRKAIYERTHPETKHGASGRGRPKKTKDGEKPAERFTLVTARKLGRGEAVIQELIRVAELSKSAAGKERLDGAKTTAQRNKVTDELLREARQENKIKRLEAKAAQRQEDLLAGAAAPIRLTFGPWEEFAAGEDRYELICTDPPYDLERNTIAHAARASINPDEPWDKLDVGWVLKAAPLLVKGGQILAFCPGEAIGEYKLAFKEAGLDYRGYLVWCKTNPGTAHRPTYLSATECVVWATKGTGYFFDDSIAQSGGAWLNWMEGPICQGSARLHPTQKPDWIIERLLRRHATRGHRVLDPFAGSGTTGVVCKRLGLECDLYEREQKFLKMAKARLAGA